MHYLLILFDQRIKCLAFKHSLTNARTVFLSHTMPHDFFSFHNFFSVLKCAILTQIPGESFICITFPQLQSLYGMYDDYYGESSLLTVVNQNIKGFC